MQRRRDVGPAGSARRKRRCLLKEQQWGECELGWRIQGGCNRRVVGQSRCIKQGRGSEDDGFLRHRLSSDRRWLSGPQRHSVIEVGASGDEEELPL